jgi:type I restriction enzyme S subunit
MKWKPYPKYKESGIPFMGNIPNTWSISKTSYVFRSIGSGTTPKSDDPSYYDGNIPWVTTTELRETYISDTKAKLTQKALLDFSALKLYPSDTLLIAMYGATVGRLGILTIPATVNQACCAFSKPNKVLTRFFYYWLLHWKPILIMLSAGAGQPNISQEDLKSLRFPLPTLEEQCAIVTFLDNETSRIDNLISKKQRQIELLQEKRSVLISRAVTKGLDPNVKMKDSGVEWLGEIPEHWNTSRIATICIKITNGYVGPTRDVLKDSGIRYLQSLHIKDGRILFEREPYFVPPEWAAQHAKSTLKIGDVLIVQTGDIGQCAVVPKEYEGANCHALIILSVNKNICLGDYIALVMNSNYGYQTLKTIQTGALHPHLNCEHVRDIIVPIPPIKEQKEIISVAENRRNGIDKLSSAIRFSIEKLNEYRAALISAAVTGKIDVRQEV